MQERHSKSRKPTDPKPSHITDKQSQEPSRTPGIGGGMPSSLMPSDPKPAHMTEKQSQPPSKTP